MHDLTSALTSYGIAAFALFFQQDLGTYAAIFGLVLVIVRIMGDIPRAIKSWKELIWPNEDENDSPH